MKEEDDPTCKLPIPRFFFHLALRVIPSLNQSKD